MTLIRTLTSSSAGTANIISPSSKAKGKLPMYRFPTSSSSNSRNSEDTLFDDEATLFEVDLEPSDLTESPISEPCSCYHGSPKLGDFVFDNSEEDFADYIEIVRAQVQGLQLEIFPEPQRKKGKKRSRSLLTGSSNASLQQQPGEDPFEFSSYLSHSPSSSSSCDFDAVPSLTYAETPILSSSSSPSSPPSPMLSPSSSDTQSDSEYHPLHLPLQAERDLPALKCNVTAQDIDERWQRSLAFAQWSKRGRSGLWEAPEETQPGLQLLISSIEC